jgi:hypothetical protein
MAKIPDKTQSARQKVSVQERRLLVTLGKSKKLTALANDCQPILAIDTPFLSETTVLSSLKPEIARELTHARKLIDHHIHAIMLRYPTRMKNKLFSLRFGSIDALKAMNIKAAFKHLGMDDALVKMRLIAELDFYGNDVSKK